MNEIPYCDNRYGQLSVTVELQYTADVFLVDQANYNRYQQGANFTYFGGNYSTSPVTITVDGPGRWYLIVDYGGSSAQYSYEWS
ncbi:DUF1883 domain-containing protein [Levilactobacillus brevis]|uniref:DUF1883 domain-containing protein n=1 Tax=Levilactobacillus brevis TaxID=1580 RepID=UPI000B3EC869|nr:DUF1883 domain-containing protein [Levilactobacillus brevis]ARW50483.1 hypothetical protein S101106_00998 [Levilactobacillus brevis]MDM7552559.1 DUF1883 domain-containing protein [Levilactobacillus brevis]MDM7649306.1 DUF1883 domain-containing protein [Levilactobacillus brevis]WAE45946.1 DUF1883 domain-containing protein [Levilactobacillus brevis]